MFDQCRCVNTTRTSHTHTHSLESSTNSVFLTSDSFSFHSEIVFVSSTFFFFFSSTLQLFSIDDATAPGRILWLPFLFLLILHLVDVVLCFSQNRSNIEKFVFTTRVHTHTYADKTYALFVGQFNHFHWVVRLCFFCASSYWLCLAIVTIVSINFSLFPYAAFNFFLSLRINNISDWTALCVLNELMNKTAHEQLFQQQKRWRFVSISIVLLRLCSDAAALSIQFNLKNSTWFRLLLYTRHRTLYASIECSSKN